MDNKDVTNKPIETEDSFNFDRLMAEVDDDVEEASGKDKKKKKKQKMSKKARRRLIFRLLLVLLALIIIGIIAFNIYSRLNLVSKTHLRDSGFKHAARFNNCIRVQGIDVSEFQGEIKWKKVKSSEADFAFIRAGYRKAEDAALYTDETFRTNVKKAHKAGVMVGVYFYSQAITEDEAIEEAKYLVKLVKNYDIDLPLVIDYETMPGNRIQQAIDRGDFIAASQFHDIVLAFCREVEDAGYESAVYANYDMLTNNMDSRLIQDETTIWVAHYGEECGLKTDYTFWQCSDSAEVGGIEGNVDRDFWYLEPGKVYETRAAGKKNPVSIGNCKIEFKSDKCELKKQRAIPEIKVTYDDETLKEGRDYEVCFVKNTQEGLGYAIVRGTKKYKDWTALSYIIE